MTDPTDITTYAIVAFLVEDTQGAFEDLMKGGEGADSWTFVARGLGNYQRATELLDAIADYNLDVDGLLGS